MRKRRKIKSAAVVLLLLFAAWGCQTGSPDAASDREAKVGSATDDLGRQVVINKPIGRIVSLAPSTTEMIFAAGAGERVVGVTTYCTFPEAARSIEKIGDTQTPNIERIVGLKPDVVFVSTASQLEPFMRTLEEQTIAVYVLDPKGVDDVIQKLRVLGELMGTESTAEPLAAELERRVTAVKAKTVDLPRPKVFVQISKDPLFTIGADSFITNLIETAGGESVTKDIPSAYPKLSKETAAAMSPEVIILSDSEEDREPNEVFARSAAVRDGQVYRINADIISRPGPRLVDALEQISGFLRR